MTRTHQNTQNMAKGSWILERSPAPFRKRSEIRKNYPQITGFWPLGERRKRCQQRPSPPPNPYGTKGSGHVEPSRPQQLRVAQLSFTDNVRMSTGGRIRLRIAYWSIPPSAPDLTAPPAPPTRRPRFFVGDGWPDLPLAPAKVAQRRERRPWAQRGDRRPLVFFNNVDVRA